MNTSLTVSTEKPANGLAGLKYWRSDVVAGLLVSLVSLPFSLGIAVASGAPPVCGLISAIIAGLLLPFLGGSYVTISGPAAGLAPVLLASMIVFGKGSDPAHLAVGYPLMLGVICIVGCVQLLLAWMKAAKYSAWFPATVVEAMLASIGLLIIAKQLPYLFGVHFESHEFWGMVAEVPAGVRGLNPRVFGLCVFCLAFLFALTSKKAPRWAKVVPAPLATVIVGAVIGRSLGLGGSLLIHVPDKPFEHGLTLPNFQGLFADRSLWFTIVTTVITLTLIDGVESLATASAVDRLDPYRRRSNPNRVLFAMGVSNICSSLVGGLTIIPGGVKSKVCIQGGGKTLWANFFNAVFLLLFLFVGYGLINMIPYAALAAMLIYTGYKLCEPAIWKHTAHLGREQLVLFASTVLVTLTTDLLWGIMFGVTAKLLINLMLVAPAASAPRRLARGVVALPTLFRNPVAKSELVGEDFHVYFSRPLVSFNALYLNEALSNVPPEAKTVTLHVTDNVPLVDHTSCDAMFHFAEDFERTNGGRVKFVGLHEMEKRSHHDACMRLAVPQAIAKSRLNGAAAAIAETIGASSAERAVAAAGAGE